MVGIISIFILWCVWSILEANREAYFFHRIEVSKEVGKHLHIMWTLQRSCVFIIIALFKFDWWLISLPLVFTALHDSWYYYYRNMFNPMIYTKKWFSQSTSSTAWSTFLFVPWVRVTMFVIGAGVLITYLLQKLQLV